MLAALLLIAADCPVEPMPGPALPLSLNLPGRAGQIYVPVPMSPPGMACHDAPPPPADVLHGEPGDPLRGPGTPHVDVEVVR